MTTKNDNCGIKKAYLFSVEKRDWLLGKLLSASTVFFTLYQNKLVFHFFFRLKCISAVLYYWGGQFDIIFNDIFVIRCDWRVIIFNCIKSLFSCWILIVSNQCLFVGSSVHNFNWKLTLKSQSCQLYCQLLTDWKSPLKNIFFDLKKKLISEKKKIEDRWKLNKFTNE